MHRIVPLQLSDLMGLVLASFVGLAPVYWFFSLSVTTISLAKYGLLGSLLLFALFSLFGASNLRVSVRLISYREIGLLLLIATLVNLINLNAGYEYIWPLAYIAILQIVSAVYFSSGGRLAPIVYVAAVIVATTCLYAIADRLLGLGMVTPLESGERVFIAGFNDSRTGWSIGLAMNTLLFTYFVLRHPTSKLSVPLLFLIGLVVFAQLISGGRSGLLTSLLCVFYLMFRTSRRGAYIFLIGLAAAGLFFVYQFFELIIVILRIDRLQASGDFSAGRLEQYVLAWQYLMETSFVPQGSGVYQDYFVAKGSVLRMHNVWVGFLLEFGLLFVAVLAYWVLRPIALLRAIDRDLAALLFIGLVPTLFEPSVIFVVITNYVAWWVLFNYGQYALVRHDRDANRYVDCRGMGDRNSA